MTPIRYRWDAYGSRSKEPGPWRTYTPGKLARALRSLTMRQERICVEHDNGQRVIVRRKPYK